VNEVTRPLTADERRLMLRLLASLRRSLVCGAEDGRDESAAHERPQCQELSERLRELNHWSSHREGLR
jgi:hypothetical protein